MSINGNDVREVQVYHALLKIVPDEVSISGKEVREEHLNHASENLVTFDVSTL